MFLEKLLAALAFFNRNILQTLSVSLKVKLTLLIHTLPKLSEFLSELLLRRANNWRQSTLGGKGWHFVIYRYINPTLYIPSHYFQTTSCSLPMSPHISYHAFQLDGAQIGICIYQNFVQ